MTNLPLDDPELVAAYAEVNAADAKVEEMSQLMKAKAPTLRYNLRNEALYVDLIVEGRHMSWRRPSDIGPRLAARGSTLVDPEVRRKWGGA